MCIRDRLFYADYFPRAGKRGGAWMSNFREQAGEVRPLIYNVASFTKPANTYWIPYNKGGIFRKWYGIQDVVVYWKNGPRDKTKIGRAHV